jgi:uncharacterized damage-inducible protein DinB
LNKSDIIELFEYCRWAKDRLLTSLDPMREEDFTRDLRSSHGSVRGTLLHIINSENIWLKRFVGDDVTSLDETKLKTVDDFRQAWDRVDSRLFEFVYRLTDEQLQLRFDYRDTKGNKYSQRRTLLLHHLANHFTYHRGQIVAMQRQMGYLPAYTDLAGFYRERDKQTLTDR